MREILFRGKDKDGKWHYAMSLSRHVTENGIITSYYIGAGNSIVSAETVGQYTGLTDKNGKKIFEGDIVALRTGRPYEVKYNNGGFELVGTAIPIIHIDKFNVIGNIYDNPELLKGGAE